LRKVHEAIVAPSGRRSPCGDVRLSVEEAAEDVEEGREPASACPSRLLAYGTDLVGFCSDDTAMYRKPSASALS
jgi:hypothetical protein